MGHKLQMYENLRDMLEREVSAIEHKNDIDETSLDNLYKLTTSLKTVDKCIEREKMEEGQSQQGQSMRGQGGNSFIGNRYVYARDGQSYDGMSMDGTSNDGMSNHWPMMRPMYYRDDGRSYDGRSYDGGSYDGMSNNSYARDGRAGRDADNDGRYSETNYQHDMRGNSNRNYYDGNSYEYSRDESRKKMVQKLETLMDDTMSENERKAIMECINKIK